MKKRPWITWSLLAVWAAALIVLIASLSIRHLAALPQPKDAALLAAAMLKYRRQPAAHFLVHVIYSECSCSRSLLTHLASRRRFPNTEELILFVGRPDPRLKNSRFEVQTISPSQLIATTGLEAAPVLLIFNPSGALTYAGGYYDHPAANNPLDEKIQAALLAQQPFEPLPIFGCAISPRLQNSLNPFRIRPF